MSAVTQSNDDRHVDRTHLADHNATRVNDGRGMIAHPDHSDGSVGDIERSRLSNDPALDTIGDAVRLSADNLTPTTIILGTGKNDFLVGTDGNDYIVGRGGEDNIRGSAGDDIIDGSLEDSVNPSDDTTYDQVDYEGALADFTFTRNDDGSVTAVSDASGIDTLIDIEGIWFIGEQKWYSIEDAIALSAEAGNQIDGTAGDDYIIGTVADDIINAGEGLDVIQGSAGDDRIDGGDLGYNQVDYPGVLADYRFSQNSDGTIRVEHPDFGTDTLANIQGFWFFGENRWYSLDDVLAANGALGGVFDNDDNGGRLNGTAGDETFLGGAGNDVFYGGKGDDTYLGDANYDQVDLDGNQSDYTFTRNADGTVTVSSADYGQDLLKDIEGIWFLGESKWYSLSDLLPAGGTFISDDNGGRLTGTEGDDTFRGGAGNDVFYGGLGNDAYVGGDGYDQVDLDGSRSDYVFNYSTDGTVTASSADYGDDVLKDIEGIWFLGDAAWASVDELAA